MIRKIRKRVETSPFRELPFSRSILSHRT